MKELLRKIEKAGLVLDIVDGKLKLYSDGTVDPEILSAIRIKKDEITAYLIQNDIGAIYKTQYENIPLIPLSESYPISDAQRRLWVLNQFEGSSVAYNIPGSTYLNREIDVTCFKKAIEATIERHEILRTVFKENKAGEIRQWILKKEDLGFKIDYKDFRKEQNKRELVQSYIKEDAHKAFDLVNGPLLRAGLLQVDDKEYVFCYNMHHIISDGWSIEILSRDVFSYYEAYKENKDPIAAGLKPLRIQYKDYSAWQLAQLEQESFKVHRNYWLESLKGELPLLDLPGTKQRPKIKTHNGRGLSTYIDRATTGELRRYTQENGGSLFMSLLAVWNVLMYRYTSQADIITGIAVEGREHADLEDQIGFYINTLALRNEIDPAESFNELFSKVKQATSIAYSHQMYPFDRLVEELSLQRDTSRNAVFDVLLGSNNTGEKIKQIELDEKSINSILDSGRLLVKYDLELNFIESGDYISIQVNFNEDVYEKHVIENVIKHYKSLASQLIDYPGEPIGKIDFLSEKERDQLILKFNDTKADYAKSKTIIDLFDEQVTKAPDREAIKSGKRILTYKALDEISNQLANCLIKDYGVRSNDLVGIKLDREEWAVISILGVLKSGAAYVPIDPEYPVSRKQHILSESGMKLLITDTNRLFDEEEFEGSVFAVDVEFEKDKYSGERVNQVQGPASLAYVIYTSGSTGNPKGVMIDHGALMNYLSWAWSMYSNGSLNPLDFGLFTSLSFDLTVTSLYLPLISGGKLSIFDATSDISTVLKTYFQSEIKCIKLTPAHISLIKSLGIKTTAIRVAIIGGDRLENTHVETLKNLNPEIQTYNEYGPTESTVGCITKEILSEKEEILIGKPISNTEIYILNEEERLQPTGVTGEICIGGSGLARGYLNNEALTLEKFIKNPLKEGERLYKTGDLGRWLPDGNIVFLGRKDDQVKIRGYRVELGEIENALSSHKGVESCAVLVSENGQSDKSLIAYVVPNADTAFTVRRVLNLPKAKLEFDAELYEMENGISMYSYNKSEAKMLYTEVFSNRTYDKNGITVPPNACIIDVGANVGAFSIYAMVTFKDAQIYSFEPLSPIYDLLKNNTSLYRGNIKTFNIGISDKEEEAVFDYYPYATVLSGKHSENYKIKEAVKRFISNSQESKEESVTDLEMEELLKDRLITRKYTCKLKTLSQVISENEITKIDLLKIDAENAEMDILKGISEENWQKIDQIIVEVFNDDDRLEKVKQMLSSYGFNVSAYQSEELDGTNFYDVYAIKQKKSSDAKTGQVLNDNWYGTNTLVDSIRQKLGERLPDYMIPSDIIFLENIPLTSNGKLDRKTLAGIARSKSGRKVDFVAPGNETEEKLLKIWQGILQKENISVKDDFFTLGGHSLKAVRLSNDCQKEFSVKLSLKDLFAHTTIESHAKLILSSTRSEFNQIERAAHQESFPISDAQRRLWVLSQFEGSSAVYNIPASVYLNREIDIACFKKAIDATLERHEILRTVFKEGEDGSVRQRILQKKDLDFSIDCKDFRKEESKEEKVKEYITEDSSRPFDLEKGPLLRAGLLQVEDEAYVFYYNMHHIISDGWSMEVLSKDVLSYYEAYKENKEPALTPLRIQYKDYSAWQLAQLEKEEFKAHREYWLESLKGELPLLDLAGTKPRPGIKTHNGRGLSAYIDSATTGKLRSYSQENGGSLFMGLLAAWNILMYRYTSQTDVIIGTPVAGREHADLEDQIGFYVNTLALRNEIRPEESFETLFSRIKQTTLTAYSHQMYPFDRLVEELDLQRDTSRSALFDMMLVFQNIGERVRGAELSEEVFSQVTDLGSMTSKFDMDFTFQEIGDYLSLHVTYNTDIYDQDLAESLIRHYNQLLRALLNNPEENISQIDYLAGEEKRELLHIFNDTKMDYPKNKTIVDLFEAQVEKTPEQVAVIFEGKELTYKELNEQSNQLAHYLQKNYAVKPGDLVGIKQERSEWMLISILGILKSGGAYVPIDPEYPADRIDYIERDTQCKVCIDEKELGRFRKSQNKYSKEKTTTLVKAGNLAYVIYTSGSTGMPKGVMIEHGGLSQFVHNFLANYYSEEIIRQPFVASVAFDISVFQMFYPLLTGGQSIIVSKKDFQDVGKFMEVLDISTVIDTVPAMYEVIVNHIRSAKSTRSFNGIKQVFIGGDRISDQLLKSLRQIFSSATIIVTYGPTEGTIFCTDCVYHRSETDQAYAGAILGTPNSNVLIYILSKDGQLQPKGLTGEICIGGPGLARGYLNRDDLTGEKFIPNPFKAGERLYKTGDLGRWLPDGRIQFIGREDDQVKIRGYRIELGEIEHALLKNEQVEEAVVLAKENEYGEKELVAYITSKVEQSTNKLRSFLKETLPEYMLPAYYIQLEALPLNNNGKVDKKVLPDLQGAGIKSGIAYAAPRNEIEEKLLRIWQKILRKEDAAIGIDEGFFEAGGNSIKLIALRSQIEREFKTDCQVASLFQFSTIRLQADMLLTEKSDGSASGSAELEPLLGNKDMDDESNDIAVIGMAIRAPGAKNIHEFWENLRNGKESITHFSKEELLSFGLSEKEISHKNYVGANIYLEDKECFDAGFFGYLPDEAKLMDPQTRVFHEVVWSALEDSGYDPLNYKGLIGLYAGAGSNLIWEAYSQMLNEGKIDEITAHQLSDKDFLNTLIAHRLNLNGPANSINTACSTSLVAIHHAALSLLSGGNNIAVAGGVSIKGNRKEEGYSYQEGMLLSKDGHNRTFDKEASGTIGSEGAGAVVLKRLSEALRDGDQVYAIIKGSAINNDGSRKVGYTAPSVDGQFEVIRLAHKMANINPESISYVEAHGTATKLGDPIEVLALTQAFGKSAAKYCALGSVKTNMGHLDAAAGVAGFIKTALCLKHKTLVPSLHFEKPNPEINFNDSPFYVNTELKEWPGTDLPRRAGVSSFGIGGTNAHVVLQEPLNDSNPVRKPAPQIITLSAKTQAALIRQQENLKKFLEENKNVELTDVAWTLQNRRAFPYRSSFVAQTANQAIEYLGKTGSLESHSEMTQAHGKKIVFMFSGQGSQYENMGRALYEAKESVFRKTMDQCFEIAGKLTKLDFKAVLYPGKPDEKYLINETVYTQPLLFMFEYSLARQMAYYGIKPEIMIGHSIGEYTAACLSEAITLEDTLKMVIKRGELMQSLPKGAMLALGLPVDKIEKYLSEDVALAAVNAPGSCVLSGNTEAISRLSEQLGKEGIPSKTLHTSHAFHSAMMDPILDEFTKLAESIEINSPAIPYISNLTGRKMTEKELQQKSYWSNHIRGTVKFSSGITEILSQDNVILIEIGPGNTLSAFARQHFKGKKPSSAHQLIRQAKEEGDDSLFFLNRISDLWQSGLEINWKHLQNGNVKRKISLPTYPFEPTKYPLAKGINELLAKVFPGNFHNKKEDISEWFYEPSWKRARLIPSAKGMDKDLNYLVLCDDCEIAQGLIDRIRVNTNTRIVQVRPAAGFERLSELEYRLDPKKEQDYLNLFNQLAANGLLPDKIVHAWHVTPEMDKAQLVTHQSVTHDLDIGYYSLLNIARAIGTVCPFRPVSMDVITNMAADVNSEDVSLPSRVTMSGPVLTIPKEYTNILCRHIDIKTGDRRDILLDKLFNELRSEYGPSSIAYREGNRWVQFYDRVKVVPANHPSGRLKQGGVYLITGGMGGIGVAIGKYLSAEFNAKLILTGRKPKSRIDTTELKNIGKEVVYLDVDVSNAQEMERKVSEAEAQFGKINGIFHAAGIADYSGIIQNRTKEQCEAVFASKIYGTITLNELAESRNVDILLLCSSAASVAAPFGSVGYTAANIFQDSFARSAGNNIVQSIGWDTWSEAGMAVAALNRMSEQEQKPQLAFGLSHTEGIEVLKRVLAHEIPCVTIQTRDIEVLTKKNEYVANPETEESKILQIRPALATSYEPPVSETEKAISMLFSDYFGINEIGIDDNFFDFGMDSLKAMALIRRIHQKLNIQLRINDILEHSNIRVLAKEIDLLTNIGQMQEKRAVMNFENKIEL